LGNSFQSIICDAYHRADASAPIFCALSLPRYPGFERQKYYEGYDKFTAHFTAHRGETATAQVIDSIWLPPKDSNPVLNFRNQYSLGKHGILSCRKLPGVDFAVKFGSASLGFTDWKGREENSVAVLPTA